MLQIDETGNQRERYIIENGVHAQVPFYSANGLKGALRNPITNEIAIMTSINKKYQELNYGFSNVYFLFMIITILIIVIRFELVKMI